MTINLREIEHRNTLLKLDRGENETSDDIDALVALVRAAREAMTDCRSGQPQCRGCYCYLDRNDTHTDTCPFGLWLAQVEDES